MEEITIHPHLFNPIYYHILDALKDPSIRHIYLYGSSSAAKTFTVAQTLMIEGENQNFSSIVFRKEQASIRDTIYNDFKEINESFDLGHELQQFVIKLVGGQVIRFRGLDTSGKVKGLKGYKKILLDELDHFVYDDYKELKRRLRGEDNQQIIYTWNPISKEHWIKTKIIDQENWTEISRSVESPSKYATLNNNSIKWINDRKDSILIKTTYHDNFWVVGHPDKKFGRVDLHALTEFDIMAKLEPEDYKIYGLGEWGDLRVTSPYITAFEEHKHVSDRAVFNTKNQFVISFDFNIGNTACNFFHFSDSYIHVFDEMVANDLPEMLEKIKFKYQGHLHKCLITGDRSGNNRTHMISDDMNSYRLIKNSLNLSAQQFKVIVNPTHKENRSTCNFLLAFHPDFIINPLCTRLIYDLKYVECDDNQQIIKKDRNIANQKADFLDEFRYFINTFKKAWIKNYHPKH